MNIGCVVMAAGDARRFGENKLAALFDGKTLIRRALEAVPSEEFSAVAVVTQYPEVEDLAAEFGFIPVRNPHPDWGISHTIRLGLEALGDCEAALFQVSDQPMLCRETVAAEVAFFREHPDKLVGLSHGGVRGNPCIFPAAYFPELLALTEDHGGSSVIRRHEEDLLLFECPARELEDADTRQALRAMEERKRLI
jgi:molybdenum cofactor cytidylyltransferase